MEFLRSLFYPKEIYNLIRYKMGGLTKVEQDSMSESLQTCYKYLNETGRSYAPVIQAVEGELRHVFCIFYVVLKAMDTVEDDMTISLETKIPILKNFHNLLYQPDWRFMDSKKYSRQVLEDFPTISREFRNLGVFYQEVIANAVREVAFGMAEYLQKQIEFVQDLDKYCDYVSSSLTRSLSVIFSVSGLEDPIVGEDKRLSNSFGQFLQKTNIIRDFLEDQLNGQAFWPKEVWSKYGKNLSDFTKPENSVPAVQCLNELITNALQYVPDVLLYLSRLRNQSTFKFCAVPLMMAIATLATCYNNPQVFQIKVKIRRGQAVTLMMDTTDMQAVEAITCQYVEEIYRKIPLTDPSSEQTRNILATIRKFSIPNGSTDSAKPGNWLLEYVYIPYLSAYNTHKRITRTLTLRGKFIYYERRKSVGHILGVFCSKLSTSMFYNQIV
ncbi:squalene synthase-like [Rana temporaria]|uniref:squalene synthase-like n=1 Tax=Rana temporaria TaxID=8407 RepID=UPI001AAD7495|nr:squalene synthase-like [Rana temporaria]